MGLEPLARAPRAKEEPWFVGLFVRLQDFFRVGKVLQVDFTVTIDKNHGCKKIF